jgi:hypothetical protein
MLPAAASPHLFNHWPPLTSGGHGSRFTAKLAPSWPLLTLQDRVLLLSNRPLLLLDGRVVAGQHLVLSESLGEKLCVLLTFGQE